MGETMARRFTGGWGLARHQYLLMVRPATKLASASATTPMTARFIRSRPAVVGGSWL
jgi:hypothetical protein